LVFFIWDKLCILAEEMRGIGEGTEPNSIPKSKEEKQSELLLVTHETDSSQWVRPK
jgi:hypothetical protein